MNQTFNKIALFHMFFCLFMVTIPQTWSSELILIHNPSYNLLENMKIELYARHFDSWVCGADTMQQLKLREFQVEFQLLDSHPAGQRYYFAYSLPSALEIVDKNNIQILYRDNNSILIRSTENAAEQLSENGWELRRISLNPKPLCSSSFSIQSPYSRNSLVDMLLSQVSEDIVYLYCGNLSGENVVSVGGQPHTIVSRYSRNTEQIEKATQYAYEFFQQLDYPVEYHHFDGYGERNVIAFKEGSFYPDRYVMICAHLDDMPPGQLAPGADDNASGSVAVMIAAELLRDIPLNKSIIFALWTGEEQGLIGSSAYAEDAYYSDIDINAVLNLDMIAWNKFDGPGIELHAALNEVPSSVDLANYVRDIIYLYQLDLAPIIDNNGTGASDHAPFWDYGIPAILAIEDFSDFNEYYHTINDRLEYLNIPYFTEFVRASLASIAHLAGLVKDNLYGDIDVSGRIDGIDLVFLCRAYGTQRGDEDYNYAADLDQSGEINDTDLAILESYFGLVLPEFM